MADKGPSPEDRLKQGTAPQIVAAMYGLDVAEMKKKKEELDEAAVEAGETTAQKNAEPQPEVEAPEEVAETNDFGVTPKPEAEEAPVEEEKPVEEPKEEAPVEEKTEEVQEEVKEEKTATEAVKENIKEAKKPKKKVSKKKK